MRAGDPGERRALSGPGLPFDEDERLVAAGKVDRGALFRGEASAVGGELMVKAVGLRVAGSLWKRRHPGLGESVSDRDDGAFFAAVLAGGAGPVSEHEDLLPAAELFELLKRSGDGGAGGSLQGDGAGVAGGERRVELGEPPEHFLGPCGVSRWRDWWRST